MFSEEFEKCYFDLFPQCILILDCEGTIIFVNNSLKEWLGYEKEDVIGKSTFQIPMIKSSCFPEMKKNFQLRLNGEEIPPYEIELIKESGEPAYAEVTGTVIPEKRPYLIIVLRNVTEEKRILKALSKSESEYRFLFEESPVSLWEEDLSEIKTHVESLKEQGISDLERYFDDNPDELKKCIGMIKILKVNKAGLEIYGGKTKGELPENLEDTFIDDSYDPFKQAVIAVSENCRRFQTKVWRRTLNGKRVLLALRLNVAPGYEQTYGKVLISIVDITENKRIEEKLAKADKLESLGILAGGIAHDFNNILAAIMGHVTLASMLAVNPEVRELLKEAENATEKAKCLTQQLLTFSKGGAPIMKPANLQEIVEEVAKFSLRGSRAKYSFDFDRDLEFARVDEGQIGQVINNLVINASQAMPEGGAIYIYGRNVNASEIENLPDENKKYIEIGIRDTGVGIAPGIIDKIFDPFFSTKEGGNGLGLSSCYSIVKRHGGCIDVKSEPGKGTVFKIYLPAYQKSVRQIKPLTQKPKLGNGLILAIDDDEAIRRLYKVSLEKLGYKVELAKNGEEGIEKYREGRNSSHSFDAAIIDLTIPGECGGSEILNKLKSIDPGVKAIVASGYHDNPVVACYREYGFVERISKPFTVNQLSQVVSKVLR